MDKAMQGWVVTIHGPNGAKQIELTEEQVEFFVKGGMSSPYAAAAWLAYCDVWTGAGPK